MSDSISPFTDVVTIEERRRAYRAAGYWRPSTLSQCVAAKAASDGDAFAVIDRNGGRARTYAELERDAVTLAHFLRENGVGPGRVVSIQLPNTYETVVATVAVQALGGVINPLLPNYRAHELTNVFSTVRPAAILTPGRYREFYYPDMIDEVARATGVAPLHVVLDDVVEAGDASLLEVIARGARTGEALTSLGAASDVSEVIFTSGTESRPKAVLHTEETSNFAGRIAFFDLAVAPDQRVWMPSPVGHSTGLNYGTRASLVAGRTLILQDRWDPSDAIEMIRRHRGSFTLAATTFLQGVVEECERTGTRLTEMSHFGCGGAPVPEDLVRRAEEVGVRVLRLYGSTEALCGTWNRPESPFDKRSTTDGPALSHTDLSIRDDEGEPVAPGEEGELHLRGPNTSVGYYDDPERTAATYLEGGWVRSGDLATVDAEGYLTVVGRKKEIIIRGGLNIAPREIEDMLATFPEVERAAVVGVPSERLGEQSCACVVLRPGASLTLGALTDRLRAMGLAIYKLPELLRVMDALPMTASGKVQKHVIQRALLDEEEHARVTGGTPS